MANPESQKVPDEAARPDPATGRSRAGGPRGQDAAVFRQEQIDEHLRYRKAVDATDRQAWEKAVPELRAAWEEHKTRYPERPRAAPLTQPDGAWVAAGGRRLTPEQNAEATKACADLRAEANRDILPAMRRVEAASPDGRLAGLNHMLKGEDRLKEKVAEDLLAKPEQSTEEAIAGIADPVRFTLTYPTGSYTEGVLKDVSQLKKEGFELLKLKNLWPSEQYKGINSQWLRPESGTRFEMQFHTSDSLAAKELTHGAYERLRGVETSPAEHRELRAFQRATNALLATPPNVIKVKDYPER